MRVLFALLLMLLAACEVSPGRKLGAGAPCDPAGDARCEGPGGSCLSLGAGAGVCTHVCSTDDACPAGLTCQLEPGGTSARCAPGFRCEDDEDCPAGHRCDVAEGICFIPVQRSLCSPCSADAQCPAGGRCVEARATGERYCSAPCAGGGSCPDGFVCREVDGSAQCLPERGSCHGGRALCATCSGDSQCGDGNDLCVQNFLSGERFCGVSCDPACTGPSCESACPENFRCADLAGDGTGPFQCVPWAGTCTGWCDGDAACAPGQRCDRDAHRCIPATDGRACAPCVDDDGCTAQGARCVVAEGAGETPFCAPLCAGDEDCLLSAGPGFVCGEVGESRVCVPAAGSCGPGVGRLGASCGAQGAAGCLSGICLRGGDAGICSAACARDADCGDGTFQCCQVVGSGAESAWDCSEPPGQGGGVCAPRGGFFGDACDSGRPPCQDGHCLDLGTARICTAACGDDADCDRASGLPGSFRCRLARTTGATGNGAEAVRICFPAGGGAVGSDCSFGPAACADQLCIKKSSGNVCTRACAGDGDCPEGWTCGSTTTVDGQEVAVCLPESLGG